MSELTPYVPDVLQIRREALHEQQQALKERQLAIELQMAAAAKEEENRQLAARLQQERELLDSKAKSLRLAQEEFDREAAHRQREIDKRMKALDEREKELNFERDHAKEKTSLAILKQERTLQDEAMRREAARQAEHEHILAELEHRRAALEAEELKMALDYARKEEELKREEARLAGSHGHHSHKGDHLEEKKAQLEKEYAILLEAAIAREKERLSRQFAEKELALRREEERLADERALLGSVPLSRDRDAELHQLKMQLDDLRQELQTREETLQYDEQRLRVRQETLEEDIAMHERQHRVRMELLEEREAEMDREMNARRAALDARERMLEEDSAMHRSLEDDLRHEADLQLRIQHLRDEENELRARIQLLLDEEVELKLRLNRMQADEERMSHAFHDRVQRWKEEESRIAADMAVVDRRMQVMDVVHRQGKHRNEPMTEAPELLKYAIIRQIQFLEMHSPYKTKAKLLGWLEPTLLLAVMGEADQTYIKRQLLVNLDTDETDSFYVAYQLITDRSRGLAYETENEFRAQMGGAKIGPTGHGQSCWYDALCETLRRTMPASRAFHDRTHNEKLKECDDPRSRVIQELERGVFKMLEKQIEGMLTEAHKATCRAILSTPRAAWLKANLRAANWPELDALWIALAVLFSERQPELLDEMELDEPEFWSFSGPQTATILRAKSELVNSVFRLLITRLELAGKGIDLAPFFDSSAPPLLTAKSF